MIQISSSEITCLRVIYVSKFAYLKFLQHYFKDFEKEKKILQSIKIEMIDFVID